MTTAFFLQRLRNVAACGDDSEKWLIELKQQAENKRLPDLVLFLDRKSSARDFLSNILTLSPFLRESFLRYPEILAPLLSTNLFERIDYVMGKFDTANHYFPTDEAKLKAKLRQLKREVHCLIALADLANIADFATIVGLMSRLAELCLKTALRFLLNEAAECGELKVTSTVNPEEYCGLAIIAMGKLGATELNYSSDIDIIAIFDSESPAIVHRYESVDFYSKLIKRLVNILQERTPDGYVFRVDLRLRPDPSSTPLALPLGMALRYYEARGQNWERAALIKARPIAGEIAIGDYFLRCLRPYIWRKYLDYAAIADIHSIKRQIHVFNKFTALNIKGHNIKLGRGGIREIEFFVQTQQLIAGGRFNQLRGRQTIAMLEKLSASNWINRLVADDMIDCYLFLRRVEHCVQMIGDQQTHTIPLDDDNFRRLLSMIGLDDHKFIKKMTEVIDTVECHYSSLFEHERELGAQGGNLVFTGQDDDPETLATLSRLGFNRPKDISKTIRAWHYGRYQATQTAQARERLTELTPKLLLRFAKTKHADEAFIRFDSFLQKLPTGVQLFTLLQANNSLTDLIVLIMSGAPRLADIISYRPHIFDGMLDPTLYQQLPERSYLTDRLKIFTDAAESYEEKLDRLRIFANEQRFLIGIRLITTTIDGQAAANAFTTLAEVILNKTLAIVEAEFQQQHGIFEGGSIALIGMGKLGSRELSASSDIDIILVYDHADNVERSNGAKPLLSSQYFSRLTQRLITALSAASSEGIVYNVDMRLRPSGTKGPLAVSLQAFTKYHKNDAWTWEHCALTRARAIAGDSLLAERLDEKIQIILAQPRNREKTVDDIKLMRDLISKEKPPRNVWDLKTLTGGIIDLEFIAQFAELMHYVDYKPGEDTLNILTKIPDNFLAMSTKEELLEAAKLFQNISQLLKVCLAEPVATNDLPKELASLIIKISGEADIDRAACLINERSCQVKRVFDHLFNHR